MIKVILMFFVLSTVALIEANVIYEEEGYASPKVVLYLSLFGVCLTTLLLAVWVV